MPLVLHSKDTMTGTPEAGEEGAVSLHLWLKLILARWRCMEGNDLKIVLPPKLNIVPAPMHHAHRIRDGDTYGTMTIVFVIALN